MALVLQPDYVAYGNDLGSRTFTVNTAAITGLALTRSPAGLAAKLSPLQTMPGDLRDHSARYSKWPSTWRSNKLLERAVEDLPRALERRHSATRIVDRRPVAYYDQVHCRREPGRLLYGQPGRVLSVR